MPDFRQWRGAALITGGSEGIGLELARQFARRGMDLLLVARSAENLRIHCSKLSAAHNIRAVHAAVDLATLDGPQALMEALKESDLTFDVLVNNAAFGIHGGFGIKGPQREAEMVRLNVSAPLELTAWLLPGMKRRKRGLILNVASTAGFAPVPWISSYAATKSFLIDWTIALDAELKGTGVGAAVLCPGTTATNFHRVAGSPTGGAGVFGQQTAEQVAEACIKGLDRGHRVITTSPTNLLHRGLAKVMPKGIAAAIARRAIDPSKRG